MEKVWDRTEADSPGDRISERAYQLIMGGTLCWGLLVNWWMVKNIPLETFAGVHPLVLIGGYLASCFAGVMIFSESSKPFWSFVGYNMVVLPFGVMLNFVVHAYNPTLVFEAVKITGLVTGGMMVLGSIFPAFFSRIASSLTIALLLVIVFEFFNSIVLGRSSAMIDWVVVVIFCGYIGVDWGRANQIPKTVDNAIDSAAALYIDIIILFVRILRILGRSRD